MKQKDKFINVSLTIKTLDIWFVRKSIQRALEFVIPDFSGRFLDIGCGKMPYKSLILQNNSIIEYIGLDLEEARDYGGAKPDIVWTKDGKIPLPDNSIECAMATEVLEHCPIPQDIVNEAFRVLNKGGLFFLTVPFIWNLHETPYDEYRYTPFAIKRILLNAGFTEIEIKAHGGWNASLGLMLGLWCRRYWKNNFLKLGFSILLFPIIWILFKTDKTTSEFKEGDMITGLFAIAKK